MRLCLLIVTAIASSVAAAEGPADVVKAFLNDRMAVPFEIERIWPAEPSKGAAYFDGEEWDEIKNDGHLVRIRLKTNPEPAGKLQTEKTMPKPERYDMTCLVFEGDVLLYTDSPGMRLPNEQQAAWRRRTGGRIPDGFTSAGYITLRPSESQIRPYMEILRDREPWLTDAERREKATKMYQSSKTYVEFLQDIVDGKYRKPKSR